MKKTIVILLCFVVNIISCQEINQKKMIQQFILDLFNEQIPPKKVVDTYLEIKLDERNQLSLEKRKEEDRCKNNKSKLHFFLS